MTSSARRGVEFGNQGARGTEGHPARGPVNQIRLTGLHHALFIRYSLFAGGGRRQDEAVVHPDAVPCPGNGGVEEAAQRFGQHHDQRDAGAELAQDIERTSDKGRRTKDEGRRTYNSTIGYAFNLYLCAINQREQLGFVIRI